MPHDFAASGKSHQSRNVGMTIVFTDFLINFDVICRYICNICMTPQRIMGVTIYMSINNAHVCMNTTDSPLNCKPCFDVHT